MKTFFVALILLVLLALAFLFSPAFAQGAVIACVPHNPYGLDFCPLIPVINGMIVTVAGILTAASPIMAYYIVTWLRNHGIAVTQAGQKLISDRIGATIQNGLKFAEAGADAGVSKLSIEVKDPKVATAANYVIAQSPDLLKKAGIDITTDEGQATVVRRITAEMQPALPGTPPTVDLNVKQV